MGHPYGITLFDQFVYWTDWEDMAFKAIYRADKHNGTNARFIVKGDDVFRDVTVFSPQRQQQGGPCVNNGGCEELCLAVSPSQRR